MEISYDEWHSLSNAININNELLEIIKKMRNCENCKHKGQWWICDWCADKDRWEFDG